MTSEGCDETIGIVDHGTPRNATKVMSACFGIGPVNAATSCSSLSINFGSADLLVHHGEYALFAKLVSCVILRFGDAVRIAD